MRLTSLSNVLITGVDGMVGSYVDFGIKTNHHSLDITNLSETMAVIGKYKPEVIIHLAAETDVDRCEREPERAYMVNSTGTLNVANAAKKIGAKVVYVSTVYVFDGSKHGAYLESDLPCPSNHYGRSKYFGELIIKGILDDYLIARAGWVFGGGPEKDRKFVAKIIKQLQQDEVKVVDDKLGSLTYAKDLVDKIKTMIVEGKSGLVHVANAGFCSRYDVAIEIKKIMNSHSILTPVDSSYFNLDASRSDSDIMESLTGGIVRPWQEALSAYIATEWI